MAVDRNVTWKEYNGTDYDNLYPKTKDSNVLLSAESKEKLGITGDEATIANAFTDIVNNGAGFAVGDTLTTRRQNLGDKWLLCNGATVQAEQYPELSQLFQDIDLTKSGTFISVDIGATYRTFSSTPHQRYKKVGDYWIIIVSSEGSSPASYNVARYSATPKDSSSWQDLSISVAGIARQIKDICYYQGKYVAVSGDLAIYYSDTIDGTYTSVSSGVSGGRGFDFVATDGTRVFVSRKWSDSGSYGSLVRWTSNLFGSATFKDATGYDLRRSGNKIYWEPSGYQSTTTGLRVYNESTDSWVNAKAFISGTEKQITSVSGPVYVNGKYYAALGTKNQSGSADHGIYASDDGVTFNYVGGSTQYIYCAIDNTLVATNRFLYKIENSGNVSTIGTLGVSSLAFNNFDGMNSSDIAFVCTTGSTSTTISEPLQISYVNSDQFVLPSISLDKTYTYIKAKT